MESFFATVTKEEADRFPSYSDAKMALFDYMSKQRIRHRTGKIETVTLPVFS